jgi:molybdenum cofactor cytidylyltransferase
MSPHSKSEIGAIILAAGGSSRFGRPKQLLTFRGKTLLRTIVDAACKAGCSPVVVVTGNDDEKTLQELAHVNAIKVQNKNWQRGIGSSIRIGVQALIDQVPDVTAVLLLVCDQPAVDERVIEGLFATREATKKDIVASSYADTAGVPAVFNRSLFKELLALADESGAKSIIQQNPERVAQFAFPKGAIDIDTWEDWEELNERNHSKRSEGSHT